MEQIENGAIPLGMKATSTDDFVNREDIGEQISTLPAHLPEPVGHRIVVLALTIPEKVGSIITIDSNREARSVSSPQGVVLALGPDAYQDQERFPSGAWCKKGDRILFQKYAGRSFRLANGQLLFILNDDEPSAVIDEGHF